VGSSIEDKGTWERKEWGKNAIRREAGNARQGKRGVYNGQITTNYNVDLESLRKIAKGITAKAALLICWRSTEAWDGAGGKEGKTRKGAEKLTERSFKYSYE